MIPDSVPRGRDIDEGKKKDRDSAGNKYVKWRFGLSDKGHKGINRHTYTLTIETNKIHQNSPPRTEGVRGPDGDSRGDGGLEHFGYIPFIHVNPLTMTLWIRATLSPLILIHFVKGEFVKGEWAGSDTVRTRNCSQGLILELSSCRPVAPSRLTVRPHLQLG
jgi:hypothetical protein